jgi:hypothetical protein
VLEIVAALGAADVRVTRSQVAYRRRRAFAWTWLPGRWLRSPGAEVVLSVSLPRRDGSARWREVVNPAPGRWMHHLEIRAAADLDDEVAAWLAEAWTAAA